METADIIDRLPFELAARLECDPFFADIPVIVAEAGNIKLEMERKQASITEKNNKRGVAVIVLQLVADDFSKNLQFGPMIIYPAFQVIENVELNQDEFGTKKSHRKVARKIRDLIKNFNLMGLVQDMKAAKPCIEPTDLTELGELLKGSQVNFECLEVSAEDQVQVQMPVYAGDGTSALTLTCPTAGAAIWFTLDDSFPYNGDADTYPASTSQLYTGPVTLAAGLTIVRAAAYLDGSVASAVNRKTIITS